MTSISGELGNLPACRLVRRNAVKAGAGEGREYWIYLFLKVFLHL